MVNKIYRFIRARQRFLEYYYSYGKQNHRLPAMTRPNLRNLLSSSAVLRRTFSPKPNLQSVLAAKSPSSHSFRPPSPPTFLENHRLFPSPGLDFLERRIFGKIFISSQSAQDVHAKCWNCNAKAEAAPFLVCQSCRCIQPLDHSVDYFQIFGL